MDDAMLLMLVKLADENEVETGITISLRGTLISGCLMSTKKYLSRFGVLYAGAIEGLGGEAAIDLASAFDAGDGSKVRIGYLHLKDARVITPDGETISSMQSAWRVRIDSIDAFLLGEFGRPKT